MEVYTNATYPDHYQAYAAGLLEGHLTRTLISLHYNNTMRDYCKDQRDYCVRLMKFLKKNLQFVEKNAKLHREQDPYWFQVISLYIFVMATTMIIFS